jgi:nondiscriminating glutamyl-tRNA synthetase
VVDLLMTVRVRIAPSPTGNLHVGTARTALFNYLFAQRHQGQFILRIEDTDLDRSEAQFTQNIYDGLKALGLTWQEGPDCGGPYAPYAQSERLDVYAEWAAKLVDTGLAYHCYLTPDELDAERAEATAAGKPYVHSGRCRDAAVREALSKEPGREPSIRFRVPDNRGAITFHDAVRGDLSFDSQLIGDFVIMKSNGTPSYNFAVVIDDMTMAISHVIRGEDHISNTPKQLLLYEAFGATPPVFAHVSMILSPDRSKLSKRHGATAVSTFIHEMGYLPEAFCNFLALLGWSPEDGLEVADLAHIAQQFDLGRLAHSGAIFDRDKLNWLNSQYIRALPLDDLLERAKPFLMDYPLDNYTDEQLKTMLSVVREPVHTLAELPAAVDYFFNNPIIDVDLEATVLNQPEASGILQAFQAQVVDHLGETPEAISQQMKTFCKALAPLKTKTIMWTVRACVTGRVQGADLGTTLWLLGKAVLTQRVGLRLPIAP